MEEVKRCRNINSNYEGGVGEMITANLSSPVSSPVLPSESYCMNKNSPKKPLVMFGAQGIENALKSIPIAVFNFICQHVR